MLYLGVERGKVLARGLVYHGPALWALELTGTLNSLWGPQTLERDSSKAGLLLTQVVRRSPVLRVEERARAGKLETSLLVPALWLTC